MNDHKLAIWVLGLILACLPWGAGCSPNTTNPPVAAVSPTGSVAEAETQLATNAPPIPLHFVTDPNTVTPVVPDKDAVRPPPPELAISPAFAEIVKLAQAGVDDSVLMGFVDTTTQPFDLGSEQIIYLNDLGVSGSVITAMIQRDQTLAASVAAAESVSPPPPPVEPIYAPPTYAAAPVPEAQPVVDEQMPEDYMAADELPPVSYDYFYDTLSPYGSWINVAGYGWCWQPTVTVSSPGWRPYLDGGRWIDTNYGWYWQSDYTWGAIAFHYGRWFCHPKWGWCWWPNTVWAPSWVTWRYTGDYCGWSPLPPYATYASGVGYTYYGSGVSVGFSFGLTSGCYSFVPWKNFCSPRPARHCLPRNVVNPVFEESVVVNNFAQGDNQTVLNKGIAVDRVSALSRTEIRRAEVRDAPATGLRPSLADRLQRENGQMVVYRTDLPQPRTEAASPIGATARSRGGFSRPNSQSASAAPVGGTAGVTPSRPATSPDHTVSYFNGREIRSARPQVQPDTSIQEMRGGGRGQISSQSFDEQNRFGSSPGVRSFSPRTTPTPYTPVSRTVEANETRPEAPPVIGSAPNAPSAPSAPSTTWRYNSIPRHGPRNQYAPTQKDPPGSIIVVGNRQLNPGDRELLRPSAANPAADVQAAQPSSPVTAPPATTRNVPSRPNFGRNTTLPPAQSSAAAAVPSQSQPAPPSRSGWYYQRINRSTPPAAAPTVSQPVAAPPPQSVSAPPVARPQVVETRSMPAASTVSTPAPAPAIQRPSSFVPAPAPVATPVTRSAPSRGGYYSTDRPAQGARGR